MDDIDNYAAIAGVTELRSALAHLDSARHRIEMAAASSDVCDLRAALVPLSLLMTAVAVAICRAEAAIHGTDRPSLRVVEGGKR